MIVIIVIIVGVVLVWGVWFMSLKQVIGSWSGRVTGMGMWVCNWNGYVIGIGM